MNCDHGAMRPRHTKCPDCGEPRPTKYLLAKDNGKVRVFWDGQKRSGNVRMHYDLGLRT